MKKKDRNNFLNVNDANAKDLPQVKPNQKSIAILSWVIVLMLPFLLYIQTIKFGFTHFDDDGLIINNIEFLSDFGNAPKVFEKDAFLTKISPFYRPLQTLSYMIDIGISGGNNTWMYHLTNILLLALISGVLYALLTRFQIPPNIAVLATLFYSMHPLFVSSVAWIPARGDLLLTLFALLSMVNLIDYFRTHRYVYFISHWVCFSLALFCKETAAFLPVIYILYYFTFVHEKSIQKKYLINILLYFIPGISWYILRSKSIADFSNRADVFGVGRILSNLPTIPESIAKFFLPFDNAPIPGFSALKTSIGFLLIILIITLLFYNKTRPKKEKLFFLAWFVILVSPTMLFKHELIEYLDHRFLLPLTGILLFLLICIPPRWWNLTKNKMGWIMIGLVLIASVITYNKTLAYANPMSFYNAAVSLNPKSALAYNNRGSEKNTRGEYISAIKDFDAAIALYPEYEKAYTNRGFSKSSAGDKTGAIHDLDFALQLNNSAIDPYYYRGNAYLGLGKFQEAINDFDKFIALRPTNAEAYNYKGMAVGSMGNIPESIVNFDKAIALKPNYIEAYGNRFVARFYTKDYAGAIADCDIVLKLKPKDERALNIKSQSQIALQNK